MIYMDQLQDVMAAVMSVSGLKSNKDDTSQGEWTGGSFMLI